MPEVKPSEIQTFASIKVVGVGGAGGSAVNRMKDAGLVGVQFIAMNTDAQALHNSKADIKIHLGHNTTNGLGAGANPSVGETAARESIDEIKDALEGADMVFVTIGAGGGTGSGAGHVVAEVARELGILVVGVATKPFSFEGEKRRSNAEWAIAQLGRQVDTLITIPNDRLLQTIDRRTPLLETFKIADDGISLPEMKPVGQGYKDFSPALETFERMLLNGEIAHAGHKVLDWCMSNAVIEQDGAENRKLSKEKATGRIDLAVAAVMAAGLVNASGAERSFWESA
jgi:hypothetical protein